LYCPSGLIEHTDQPVVGTAPCYALSGLSFVGVFFQNDPSLNSDCNEHNTTTGLSKKQLLL
jgi:hypothetical protein